MVFSSTVFVFYFLPSVLLVYFLLPTKLRNLWLLTASLFFYAWGETWFVVVMLASIGIDYICGLVISGGIGRAADSEIRQLSPEEPRTRLQKTALAVSITANLSILAFFKYFNFGIGSYNSLLRTLGLDGFTWDTDLEILLPLGISFFTFQSMSYTFDVYLGNVRATRNLLNFATFVSLFPQLVAGPIVRYRDIAARLVDRRVTLDGFSTGVQRFIVGLGKKLVLANAFAVPADAIFAIPENELTTPVAWLGVFSYTMQIYFDFSGYSDMAIGLGHMFGFRFLENFNYPYISTSITEFWRRWHISLSTWFRDYLYIPAGGNRKGPGRTYLNLFLVFFLCGLWHGASWTFVVWGLFHGFLLVVERRIRGSIILTHPAWNVLRHIYVLVLVMIGWVLFRAETFSQSISFLRAMAGFGAEESSRYYPGLYLSNELTLLCLVAVLASTPIVPTLAKKISDLRHKVGGFSSAALGFGVNLTSVAALAALFVVSAMKLAVTTHNPFIYFRF